MATAPKMYGKKIERKPRRDTRQSASKRGYDSRWKKLRNAFIQHNPVCEHCERNGQTTRATEVDHIKPFKGYGDPLRLDVSNLQSLCHSCHVKKTHRDGACGG